MSYCLTFCAAWNTGIVDLRIPGNSELFSTLQALSLGDSRSIFETNIFMRIDQGQISIDAIIQSFELTAPGGSSDVWISQCFPFGDLNVFVDYVPVGQNQVVWSILTNHESRSPSWYWVVRPGGIFCGTNLYWHSLGVGLYIRQRIRIWIGRYYFTIDAIYKWADGSACIWQDFERVQSTPRHCVS